MPAAQIRTVPLVTASAKLLINKAYVRLHLTVLLVLMALIVLLSIVTFM